MRIATLIQSSFFLILCSCTRNNNNDYYRAVNRSFESSNKVIASDNLRIYYALEKETEDPISSLRATMWMQVVKKIHGHTKEILDYINSIELNVSKKTNKDEKEENLQLSKLFDKLESFKKNILDDLLLDELKKDSNILKILFTKRYEFSQTIPVFPESIKDNKDQTTFKEHYIEENALRNATGMFATMSLNKLKNDVLIAENMLTEYCFDQLAIEGDLFSKFSVVATIKSTYLKVGQENEVSAGVGNFSTMMLPKILINNVFISPEPYGVAVYKFRATGQPGKHTIPVKISFIGNDGKKEIFSKNIDYYIAE